MFYNFVINPIVLLYKWLYLSLFDLTGSYGISLLLMSVITFLVTSPFMRWAGRIQKNEKHIQDILKPQIDTIRSQSQGAEQHRRISALYKSYAYHPAMAVRSVAGLAVQIPFLIAAYYMLSELPDIKGQPFLIIEDLSKPDGLIGSINVLPILMSVINLMSAFTTATFARKDKLQAAVIAFLFLLLLYNAPSALLIFWTCNNLWGLLDNIIKFNTYFYSKLTIKNINFCYINFKCNKYDMIYFIFSILLLLFYFIFNTTSLYFSDPDVFLVPLFKILIKLIPFIIFSFAFVFVIWRVSNDKIRLLLSFISLFLFIMAMINIFILQGNYGSLDVVILANASNLYNNKVLIYDCASILIASICTLYMIKFINIKYLIYIAKIISFSMLLFVLYVSVVTYKEKTPVIHDILPKYNETLYSFSRKGKNVVVFFFDAFTGGHLEKILLDDPSLKVKLKGFTWYPDTLADSWCTILSAPAIFGGKNYTPLGINKQLKGTLKEKRAKSYSIMPNAFAARDYSVSIAGISHTSLELVEQNIPTFKEGIYLSDSYVKDYEKYWYEKHSQDNRDFIGSKINLSKYFMLVSLFKLSPHYLRKYIYDKGLWWGANEVALQFRARNIVGDLAVIECMPEISNVDSKKSTFKVFYNKLSHPTWHMPEQGLIPSFDPYPNTEGQNIVIDGIIPEHLYSEKHLINFLVDFIDWLEKENIYDNTRIIVVSDHDLNDSQMLNEAFGGDNKSNVDVFDQKKYPHRPHALFMFKDFYSKGDLNISNALMACHDVPALALDEITHVEGIPSLTQLMDITAESNNRLRTHSYGSSILEHHKEKTYIIEDLYEIEGTMFEKKNWKLVNDSNLSLGAKDQTEYTIGTTLTFSINGNGNEHLLSGWSFPEPLLRWSNGPASYMYFKINDNKNDLILKMFLSGFTDDNKIPYQKVNIKINDHIVTTWHVTSGWNEYSTVIPAKLLENKIMKICFEISDSHLSHEKHRRDLGMAVQKMIFDYYKK